MGLDSVLSIERLDSVLSIERERRVGGLLLTTFVLIHGAGDSAWYWHLVEPELRKCGHDVVAMDLPCGDDSGVRLSLGRDSQPDTVGVCGGEFMTPSRSAR
jgi:pimeloyl-ACP methyl ester carboxylesterase